MPGLPPRLKPPPREMEGLAPRLKPPRDIEGLDRPTEARGAAEIERLDRGDEKPLEKPLDRGTEMPREALMRGALPEERGTETAGARPEMPREGAIERAVPDDLGTGDRTTVCGLRPTERDVPDGRVTFVEDRGTLGDTKPNVLMPLERGTLTEERGMAAEFVPDRLTVPRLNDPRGTLAEPVPAWPVVPRLMVPRGTLAEAVPDRLTALRSNVPRGMLVDAVPVRPTAPVFRSNVPRGILVVAVPVRPAVLRSNVARGMLGLAVVPRAQSLAMARGMLGEVYRSMVPRYPPTRPYP
jgi:hypothetical protein